MTQPLEALGMALNVSLIALANGTGFWRSYNSYTGQGERQHGTNHNDGSIETSQTADGGGGASAGLGGDVRGVGYAVTAAVILDVLYR